MNFNCFIIYLIMAFNHAMHIDGPNVVTKSQGMFSGIPGTTIINIHNSARIQAVFESSIDNEKEEITPQNVFKVIARGNALVEAKLGYKFKGYEGLSIEAANMTSDKLFEKYVDSAYSLSIEKIYETGIPLPFLSNKISIIDGEPICVPMDLHKFGASLVLPANTKKGNAVKSQLERVVGVLFSGGWLDDEFYEFLSSTYVDLRKVEKMKEIEVSELSADEKDVFEILEKLDPTQVPTKDFLFDMNTMDKEKFKEKYFGENPIATIANEIKESIKVSKDDVMNNQQSDFNEILREFESFNPSELPPDLIVPDKMGHGNANTIIQDEIKTKKNLDKHKRKKLRYFVSEVYKGKMKSNYLQYIEQYEDDDQNIYDEFELEMLLDEDFDSEQANAYKALIGSKFVEDDWDGYQQFEAGNGDDFSLPEQDEDYLENFDDFGSKDYLNTDREG